MAASGRTQDAALGIPEHLIHVWNELQTQAGEFDFFQAVRLLHLCMPASTPLATSGSPDTEPVRFQANNDLSFPPSQIKDLRTDQSPPVMSINFMGLTGAHGVLPYDYTDLVTERARAKDTAIAAFFDIFNHRAASLFYTAWERHRFEIAFERDQKDRLSHYLLALIGLLTPALQRRLQVPDHALLFYSGLLSMQSRSVTALESIIADFFDVTVIVRDFVGAWQQLRAADRTTVDEASETAQLGATAIAGDAVWDEQSRIVIALGPLTLHRYRDFLPEGPEWPRLRSIALFFCGTEVEVEVELSLLRAEVPSCNLETVDPNAPRLGYTSWIKSKPDFDRNPQDTVLRLI